MPRSKVTRMPTTTRRRAATKSTKYVDWLGRPITKAQYDRMMKNNGNGTTRKRAASRS